MRQFFNNLAAAFFKVIDMVWGQANLMTQDRVALERRICDAVIPDEQIRSEFNVYYEIHKPPLSNLRHLMRHIMVHRPLLAESIRQDNEQGPI
jgi:hypothetical protein